MKKFLFFLFCPVLLFAALQVQNVNDLTKLFPQDEAMLARQKEEALLKFLRRLEKIQAVPEAKRNFENIVAKADAAAGKLFGFQEMLEVFAMTCPDQKLREAAMSAQEEINDRFSCDFFLNKALYSAMKSLPKEPLDGGQSYLLEIFLDMFEKSGAALSENEKAEFYRKQAELFGLSVAFEKNIREDNFRVAISPSDLMEIPERFLCNLQTNAEGERLVGLDYPTYYYLMGHCKSASARERLYRAFNSRGYLENAAILNRILALRNSLAQLLGYPSFAVMELRSQMAKTPARVKDLLDGVHAGWQTEWERDMEKLGALKDGPLALSDMAYLTTLYKETNNQVNQDLIAQYFPFEHTLQAAMEVFSNFFSLHISIEKPSLWDSRLLALRVCDGRLRQPQPNGTRDN